MKNNYFSFFDQNFSKMAVTGNSKELAIDIAFMQRNYKVKILAKQLINYIHWKILHAVQDGEVSVGDMIEISTIFPCEFGPIESEYPAECSSDRWCYRCFGMTYTSRDCLRHIENTSTNSFSRKYESDIWLAVKELWKTQIFPSRDLVLVIVDNYVKTEPKFTGFMIRKIEDKDLPLSSFSIKKLV